MRRIRIVLGTAGVLLALFGVFRLTTQIPFGDLFVLALWLAGAVAIHDGVLSPLIVGIGWVLARFVPPRARRYLQAGLVMGAIVTIIAIPMIYRENSQPKQKAILEQNFGGNLTLLLGIIAGVTLLLYAAHVARSSMAKPQPGGTDDQPSG